MPLFFWDFNDYNDSWRQWLCFVLNVFVLSFTVFALYRSLRSGGKAVYQTIPLSFNLGSTLVLLLLKLFERGYEFDLIGYLIEIFTYFLFAFTFWVVLIKVKENNRTHPQVNFYHLLGLSNDLQSPLSPVFFSLQSQFYWSQPKLSKEIATETWSLSRASLCFVNLYRTSQQCTTEGKFSSFWEPRENPVSHKRCFLINSIKQKVWRISSQLKEKNKLSQSLGFTR